MVKVLPIFIPFQKKIFQPPHQRQRDEKLRQHELENAFERIHGVTCGVLLIALFILAFINPLQL